MTDVKKDHNYVETPVEIIDFINNSVKEIMKDEFGKSLSDKDVTVIDPFAGEGQFFERMMTDLQGESEKIQYEIDKSRYEKAKQLDKKLQNCHTFNKDTFGKGFEK